MKVLNNMRGCDTSSFHYEIIKQDIWTYVMGIVTAMKK